MEKRCSMSSDRSNQWVQKWLNTISLAFCSRLSTSMLIILSIEISNLKTQWLIQKEKCIWLIWEQPRNLILKISSRLSPSLVLLTTWPQKSLKEMAILSKLISGLSAVCSINSSVSSCLLEKAAKMILTQSIHRSKRGTWLSLNFWKMKKQKSWWAIFCKKTPESEESTPLTK